MESKLFDVHLDNAEGMLLGARGLRLKTSGF